MCNIDIIYDAVSEAKGTKIHQDKPIGDWFAR